MPGVFEIDHQLIVSDIFYKLVKKNILITAHGRSPLMAGARQPAFAAPSRPDPPPAVPW